MRALAVIVLLCFTINTYPAAAKKPSDWHVVQNAASYCIKDNTRKNSENVEQVILCLVNMLLDTDQASVTISLPLWYQIIQTVGIVAGGVSTATIGHIALLIATVVVIIAITACFVIDSCLNQLGSLFHFFQRQYITPALKYVMNVIQKFHSLPKDMGKYIDDHLKKMINELQNNIKGFDKKRALQQYATSQTKNIDRILQQLHKEKRNRSSLAPEKKEPMCIPQKAPRTLIPFDEKYRDLNLVVCVQKDKVFHQHQLETITKKYKKEIVPLVQKITGSNHGNRQVTIYIGAFSIPGFANREEAQIFLHIDDPDMDEVLCHEYTHLIAPNISIDTWLAEGIAEYARFEYLRKGKQRTFSSLVMGGYESIEDIRWLHSLNSDQARNKLTSIGNRLLIHNISIPVQYTHDALFIYYLVQKMKTTKNPYQAIQQLYKGKKIDTNRVEIVAKMKFVPLYKEMIDFVTNIQERDLAF